jgi:hypothetical protein
MGKVITSPVKRFSGTVTLADPLTFPQYKAWQAAARLANEAINSGTATPGDVDALLVPGVLACVEAWHLERFPAPVGVENFPATPRKASGQLLGWLVREITALTQGEDEDPK